MLFSLFALFQHANWFQVAAQNCRKRKIDQIAHLEQQVEQARQRKERLMHERRMLYTQRRTWAERLSEVEEEILTGLDKSVEDFALDTAEAEVKLVARRTDLVRPRTYAML